MRVLIAKCRLGVACRYHGRPVESPGLTRRLTAFDYELACPEVEAGLSIPRPPIRRRNGRFLLAGKDITRQLTLACKRLARTAKVHGITYFVGTKGSPCCDPQTGLFAEMLRAEGIRVGLNLPAVDFVPELPSTPA